MSHGQNADRDRSHALSLRAQELIRDYGPSASPRSYAVWYSYVSAEHPLMNDAVKRLIAQNGSLSEFNVDELHETYLNGRRLSEAAGATSATMLSEIESIIEVLELSLGSTAQYGESLRALTQDLTAGTPNRGRLREIVANLVAVTREVAVNNRTLEARMRESHNEIESLRETLEATRIESLTDTLTGLANRKHFEDSLRMLVEGAGKQGVACLIVLDIDMFKGFNDRYGHLTGDQVLRLVAIVMRETVGPGATLARFGGEEFGIVLPGSDRAAARAVADRVRTHVAGRELVKRSTGESLGKVTVSLGVAEYRRGDTAISLLERADLCMFAAKRAGRNRVVDDSAETRDLSEVA